MGNFRYISQIACQIECISWNSHECGLPFLCRWFCETSTHREFILFQMTCRISSGCLLNHWDKWQQNSLHISGVFDAASAEIVTFNLKSTLLIYIFLDTAIHLLTVFTDFLCILEKFCAPSSPSGRSLWFTDE